MTAAGALWNAPGFRAALREIEALGLHVTATPGADAKSYGVAAGAGSRLLLLPLQPRAACAESLALVQPLRRGPRACKYIAHSMLGFGLSRAMLRKRVYVSGNNRLAATFGLKAMCCAFLTGTAGPHRKLVAQCMDRRGNIRGYVKVSRAFAVRALIAHEAATMTSLHALGLRSAVIPRVLLHETRDGATVLAMDTVAGLQRGFPFKLRAPHLAFLQELAARTTAACARNGDDLLQDWRARVLDLADCLSAEWQARFQRAIARLEPKSELLAAQGMAHGDFTPWNSRPCGNGVFVFDWEYAGDGYPADFDLIRFLDSVARVRTPLPAHRVAVIHRALCRLDRSDATARARLLAYLCTYALRGACRQPRRSGMPVHWESERADAAMLDALLASARRDGGIGFEHAQSRSAVAARGAGQAPSRANEACRQTAPV